MKLWQLSLRYLAARWLTSSLLVLLLAIGMATLSVLLHAHHSSYERLLRDGKGFDVVLGAKGSPLQLVLSSIYHADIPTGNIPLTEAQRWEKHPQVKQAIPLALGDGYRGYRIVGTTPAYAQHYRATLQQGHMFQAPMQAVLGARVAKEAGLAMGDQFAGHHGLAAGGHTHAETPYTVVGILEPTHSVLDRLILTPVESVWQVHAPHAAHDEHKHDEHEHDEHEPHAKKESEHGHEEHKEHDHDAHAHEEHTEHAAHDEHDHDAHEDTPKEITALLLSVRSPAAAMMLPRQINRSTNLQAATPAFEIARMFSMIGVGLDTVRFFGALFVLSALVGMAVALFQAMQQRRYDLAIIRALGGSQRTLLALVMLEAGWLLSAGIGLGLIVGHGAVAVLPTLVPSMANLGMNAWQLLPAEYWAMLAIALGGLVLALLPAIRAYRVDVSKTLARGW